MPICIGAFIGGFFIRLFFMPVSKKAPPKTVFLLLVVLLLFCFSVLFCR